MRIDEAVQNELATVRDWGFAFAKNKGTPYMWIDFVFDNIQGPKGEELDIRAFLYITDGTLEYFLAKLRNLGWKGTNFTELDKSAPGYYDLTGAKGALTVDIETWEGKPMAKVNYINDPNHTPESPMDSKALKTLNEKLKGKIAAFNAKNPAAPAPAAKPNGAKPAIAAATTRRPETKEQGAVNDDAAERFIQEPPDQSPEDEEKIPF